MIFFLKTAYDQLKTPYSLYFPLCNWNGVPVAGTYVFWCLSRSCADWQISLRTSQHFCSSLQGITFAFHMHLKWVFFVGFFFYLEFIIIHFKLQIIFLRPFDNFEILLVSSCHKSFHCGCEIMLHCKNVWNKIIRTVKLSDC